MTRNKKEETTRNYQIKRFEELEIYDSFMFGKVMQNEKLCKRFLECVLEMQIAKIAFIQREYQEGISSNYRNIRLDIRVEDTKGTIHDIEMQVEDHKDLPRRSRYYQGVLDASILPLGVMNYNQLKDVYVIFICRFDPFHKGLKKYTFEAVCDEEPSLYLKDGAKRIFLNTKWKKETKEGYTEAKDITEEERELDDFLDYVENPESYIPQKPLAQQIDVEVKRNKKNQKVRDEYMTVADLIAEHVGKALEEEKKEMEAKVEAEKERADQAQQQAETEKERANQAEQEVEKLREQLKELSRKLEK